MNKKLISLDQLEIIKKYIDNQPDIYSGGYKGENLAVKFADEIANFSSIYAWLDNRVQNENFAGLRIHDYFLITLSGGEIIEEEIAGINTYLGAGPNDEKAHIDFISKDLWTQTVVFNPANYNNGITFTCTGDGETKEFDITTELTSRGATNYPHLIDRVVYKSGGADKTITSGFTYDNTTGKLTIGTANPIPDNNTPVYIQISVPILCSELYAKINGLKTCVPNGTTVNPALKDVDYTSTGLYALLPADLKTYIKSKGMYLATRGTTTAIRTSADNYLGYSYPKLWIPEEMEVYGTPMYSTGTYEKWFAKQYPCFIGNTRIKRSGRNGSRTHWWLSSAHAGTSTYFCYVSGSGFAYSYSASYAFRVPLCFRFKKN